MGEPTPNPPTPSEEDRRTKVLMALMQSSWDGFNQRRAYEWKFCLAIWAPLAVGIGLLLRGNIHVTSESLWGLGVCGVLILALQWIFRWQIGLGNIVDQKRALYYMGELDKTIGVHFKGGNVKEKDVSKAIRKAMYGWTRMRGWWGNIIQISITGLLMILAVLLVWSSARR